MSRSSRARTTLAAIFALLLTLLLSSCGLFDIGEPDPVKTSPAAPSASPATYNSQFTRDGTFQSHIKIDGVDFVYTLYPTKSTPRTNEWYPKGNKFFSFTFQAYDLDQAIRDPYSTKRKVYLGGIRVTSITKTSDGGKTQHPYELAALAQRITFDPEPLTSKYGMIITSPKGAFELRNQRIGPMSPDTRGVDLMFTATVRVQRRAGGMVYDRRVIRQRVPIAIFESDKPTSVASIPVDAN